MTPEEKAIELLNKFNPHAKLSSKKYSRRCARVLVDETLEIIRYHGTDIGSKYSLLYWEQVKEAMNLL
jgi:hypothetical protein